jgi:hypothetical protein
VKQYALGQSTQVEGSREMKRTFTFEQEITAFCSCLGTNTAAMVGTSIIKSAPSVNIGKKCKTLFVVDLRAIHHCARDHFVWFDSIVATEAMLF